MRLNIVYPIPYDAWFTYEHWVRKFAESLRQFPPGCDYRLIAVCCWGQPTAEMVDIFRGTKCQFETYHQSGCDIGAAQMVASLCDSEDFLVCLTSRAFFFKAGWGARYMQARNENGQRLYGISASKECGRLHLCTRGYGMDADLFQTYPHVIDRREKGPFFEVGRDNDDGNLLEWYQANYEPKALIVHWDHLVEAADFEKVENRFRNGNQEQMLIWDGHTASYAEASKADKLALERLAGGE